MSYTQTLKLSSASNLTKEGNLSDLNFDSQGEAVNKQKRGPFKQEFKIDQKEIIELQNDPFLSCRSPPPLCNQKFIPTQKTTHTRFCMKLEQSHTHTRSIQKLLFVKLLPLART